MKKILLILTFLILGCSVWQGQPTADCDENPEFKRIYFDHLSTIHKYQEGEGQKPDVENSLRFVSRYAPVSFESRLNYAGVYPPDVYKKDRAGWLEWYEVNKCKNLQIKKTGILKAD
ncbi:MAG: hypothetical protein ABJ092_12990 [Gillisia sp.]